MDVDVESALIPTSRAASERPGEGAVEFIKASDAYRRAPRVAEPHLGQPDFGPRVG